MGNARLRAIHFLDLMASGVFDRYPELQIILGHWGEILPYYAIRLDENLSTAITGLERIPSDYLRNNAYLTPSGIFSQRHLQFCLDVVGPDRIMFSVDYPYIPIDGLPRPGRRVRQRPTRHRPR